MKKLPGLVLSVSAILAACNGGAQRRAAETPRTVPMTRSVHIRAESMAPESRSGSDVPLLLTSPGGPDELPQGPDGFDVTRDGKYLITDPLRKRIAVFASDGAYVSEWRIGFVADSVTVAPDDSVQVREANTGDIHLFDLKGVERPGPTVAVHTENARLAGPNRGFVDRTKGDPLEVRFDKPGLTLVSLQPIPSDSPGETYLAVESTLGGDAVEVNKSVRRYSADSKLIATTSDLPLDYYIRPVNEIRVRNGVVHQLAASSSEVRINIWNLKM